MSRHRFLCLLVALVSAMFSLSASHSLALEPVSIFCHNPNPDSVLTPGDRVGLIVHVGGILYMSVDDEEVHILDYQDPTNPQVLGTIPGSIDSVVFLLNPETLITSGVESGTHVFDISDLKKPVEIEAYEYLGFIKATRSDVLYIEGDHELRVYRAIGVGAGEQVGSLAFDSDPRLIAMDQDIGFVVAGCCLNTVDFSNPDQPTFLTNGTVLYGGTSILEVAGNRLVTSGNGFTIFDISDPLNPIPVVSEHGNISVRDVAIRDDLLYVADRWFGMRVYDISDPLELVLVGLGESLGAGLGIELGSDVVFVRTVENVLAFKFENIASAIIDVQDDFFETADSAEFGGIQYVAGMEAGLGVYDMRDLTEIVQIALLELAGGVWSVLAEDNLLYAQTGSGLRVFDVADPANPIQIGSYGLLDSSDLITKIGKYIFTLTGIEDHYELIILSVADPTRPRRVSSYFPDERIVNIGQYENALYITQNRVGVEILDFENPYSPELIEVVHDESIKTLAVVGDKLVTGSTSLQLFDLDDPFHPVFRSDLMLEPSDQLLIHEVQNDTLYAQYQTGSYINSGVLVFDVSDSDHPVEKSRYPLFDRIRSMHVIEDRIGVTFYKDGVVMMAADQACMPCEADINDDGHLNFFDISAFLKAFNSLNPIADFTGDGRFNFFDVSAFLLGFTGGC